MKLSVSGHSQSPPDTERPHKILHLSISKMYRSTEKMERNGQEGKERAGKAKRKKSEN